MKPKRKESEIQTAILNYLQLKENLGELYAVRTSSGAIKTEEGRYFKTGKKGCPDILVSYKERFIGLEVKNATGQQSKQQRDTEVSIKKTGGLYFVVRDIMDVENILNQIKGGDRVFKPLYTTVEVGEELSAHQTSVINWIKEGKLKSHKTPGGHRRIKGADLKAFIIEIEKGKS